MALFLFLCRLFEEEDMVCFVVLGGWGMLIGGRRRKRGMGDGL